MSNPNSAARVQYSCVLRLLQPSDLPDLLRLKEAAGWNQTAADWVHTLALEPAGCFGIEADGQIVATTACLLYGPELAWISMVLTLPAYRGRGYARELLQRAIRYAGGRTTRLDATDMGRPLYASLGFAAEYPVQRWMREPSPHIPAGDALPLRIDAGLDRQVFGADRMAVLRPWAGASMECGSYALWRAGSNSAHFGPCVAHTSESARRLATQFIATFSNQRLSWDLFEHAQTAAAACGFKPARTLMRMVLNAAPQAAPDPRIYAIAGFDFG